MFPIIPLLAALASALGIGTLIWYYSLSAQDKARADEYAQHYARVLFRKAVAELSREQAKIVYDRVRTHFN